MNPLNGLNYTYNPSLTGKTEKFGSSVNETVYGIFNHDKGVNKEIDESVFQGKYGDCWLLSGILSLSYSNEGRELIKNAINENKDGSYDVYFKGVNKTYTITKEELDKANKSAFLNGMGLTRSKYSTGDDDILLIELAMEKLIEEGDIPIETAEGLTGGSAYYLYEIFTDSKVDYADIEGSSKEEIEELLDYYQDNQDSCAATIGIQDSFNSLKGNHAYALKSYDGNQISLINPWDTTKEAKISKENLLDNTGKFDFTLADNKIKEDVSYLDGYA